MSLPIDWCNAHIDEPPKIFLNHFTKTFQPTTVGITNLLSWLIDTFPKSHDDLKLHIWNSVKNLTYLDYLPVDTKIKTACEQIIQKENERLDKLAQQARLNPTTKLLMDIPTQQEDVSEPIDIPSLWQKHLGEHTIQTVAKDILGGPIPPCHSFLNTLILMINNAVFKLVPYGKNQWEPNIVRDYVAAFTAGSQLALPAFLINGSGVQSDRTDLPDQGCRMAFQRAKDIYEKFKPIKIKGKNPIRCRARTMQSHLLGLCRVAEFIYRHPEPVEQVMSLSLQDAVKSPVDEKTPPFCTAMFKEILIGSKSMVDILNATFEYHGRLSDALNECKKAIERVEKDVNNLKNQCPTPDRLTEWLETLMRATRQLELKCHDIFDETATKNLPKAWVFIENPELNRLVMLKAIKLPIEFLERTIRYTFSKAAELDFKRRAELFPDPDAFAINLTCLFERRSVISGYVDTLRSLLGKEEGLNGRAHHETLTQFITHPNLGHLSQLITALNLCRELKKARPGDLVYAHLMAKAAVGQYLPQLLNDAIGDAEESLFQIIRCSARLEHPTDSEEQDFGEMEIFKLSFNTTINDIRGFLEALVWLKIYIANERPNFERELFPSKQPASSPPSQANHASTKKKRRRNRKRRNRKKPSTAIPQQEGIRQETIQVASGKQEELKQLIDLLRPKESQRTELWKEKVALARRMKKLAKRVKRQGTEEEKKVSEAASREILSGRLRRVGVEVLATLRKKKVGKILNRLRKEGWVEHGKPKGDHHKFKHPILTQLIVLPYSTEADQLKPGTFNSVAKAAGWME